MGPITGNQNIMGSYYGSNISDLIYDQPLFDCLIAGNWKANRGLELRTPEEEHRSSSHF